MLYEKSSYTQGAFLHVESSFAFGKYPYISKTREDNIS